MNDDVKLSRNVQGIPNPRDLMRARHPDLFSDSQVLKSPRLTKAVFEYHLDTLTSRKQEYEFEHFCRKLAEKEICPNLRVQTGPTGGGDSKVDSETYPVAEEIAERWWVGESAAGSERWGFAFSAKKAWKPKFERDVESALSTGRDYKRIYFFTNQFVSDKDRSQLEDAHSQNAGIPIHIVDRAWIVEKVYANDHLDLAISALGIGGAETETVRRPGPLDTERLEELEEIDRQVADPERYLGARFQLVEDCLHAAILARSLERPRNEVEGRFVQTERLAKQMGLPHQLMRIAYNRAWTTHWWYEDFQTFNKFYDEVEKHLKGSTSAGDVERLLNLWQLLAPAVASGRLKPQDANIELRRKRLIAMLQPLADDPGRLNNALQARTCLTLIKVNEAMQAGSMESLESTFAEFSKIVDESATLGTYPVEQLADLVQMLGELVDSASFDTLYEKTVEAMRKRRSDGAAGEAYRQRGMQKLKQDKPYEAIQWLGRAEELLLKDEYRTELVMTLAGSSYGYERVGLLWAARNKILVAIERGLSDFSQNGEMVPATLLAIQRLVWIELQLGRIPRVLQAMVLGSFTATHLHLSEERQAAYSEEVQMQEAVLGIHLLNTPFNVLPAVVRLPDALERMGLSNARLALLFSLGQEQCILDEQYFAIDDNAEKILGFFENWRDQAAATDIPRHPLFVEGDTTTLKSTILGWEFALESPSNETSFGIAESLLGALEAFLATSNEDDLLPHKERLTITIRASDQIEGIPRLRFPDGGVGSVEILHATNLSFPTAADARKFVDWLRDSVISIAAHHFVIRNVHEWMAKVAGDERAFARAILLGDVLTINRNVFGVEASGRLSDWARPEDKAYALLRTQLWSGANKPELAEANTTEPIEFGSGPVPAELLDLSQLKHTERRIVSPIDIALWDRAKWRGTMFVGAKGYPPFLSVVFEDALPGESIFNSWRERWGNEDAEDDLRVAIVLGLSTQNPAHYAVIIGPNWNSLRGSGAKRFVLVSRINRMEPNSPANLERFLDSYHQAGAFLLAPAQMGSPPVLIERLYLMKRHLHIRQAWEIGVNDPDLSALNVDDDPFIPPSVEDAPVKRALEMIRLNRKPSPHSI